MKSGTKALIFGMVLCVIISAVILIAGQSIMRKQLNGAHVGMSLHDFAAIYDTISEDCRYKYNRYAFYETELGFIVVAGESLETMTVSSLECFFPPLMQPNKLSAKRVKPGMDLFDVIRIMGKPAGSFTSGFISLGYVLSDGTRFTVYFNNVDEMLVTDVRFSESPA